MTRPTPYTICVRGQLLDLSEPRVMGILNATPDSFFAGSRKQTEREIAERALQIEAEGGSIIDVGAFSTRPGAQFVSAEDEAERLMMALRVVRRELSQAIVSVDTFRADVARRCVEASLADMVNDVSEGRGSFDVARGAGVPPLGDAGPDSMFATVARLGVPYILMSVQPSVETMLGAWASEVAQLRSLGAKDIILDPGFGFGKTLADNYQVLAQLERLHVMGLPLLVGMSRKRMVYQLLDGSPESALNGTVVLNTVALEKGASILRVHDVREAVEAVRIVGQLQEAE